MDSLLKQAYNVNNTMKEGVNQMANADIRNAIKKKNVYQYQVAEKLGVTEWTLVRWLRKEVPEELKQKILKTVNAM